MTTEAVLTPSARLRGLIAATACVATVAMGLGITIPLLALLMERQDVPAVWIGLNTAMPALATLTFTPLVPVLMRRVPVAAILVGCIVVSAACMISYWLVPSFTAWFFIRFLNGVALTGLFVISEFWINHIAEEHRRGFIIGIFGTATSAGFASGPLILTFTGVDGPEPFAVVAVLTLAASVPILAARNIAPVIREAPSNGLASFFVVAPVATLSAFAYGAAETQIFNLLPLYLVRLDFGEQLAALVLTAFGAGNVLFQLPLGLISDRMDRRVLLLICGAVGFAGATALPWLTLSPWAFFPALFVFGGVVAGLYTVGLALLGQRFRGADLASANAAFAMLYSLGALLGPPYGGAGMDLWNPHGLVVAMALMFAAYCLIAVWRIGAERRAALGS